MAFTKFASVEEILETKTLDQRMKFAESEEAGDRLVRFAAKKDTEKTDDGYLYVRCRAISSRVNKNNDGWPSEELARSYKTFIGKPIFVDHNNDDPKRTRGVIVDAQLHVEDPEKTSGLDPYYASAPENHKPPTWIELLMEVDAKTYPKLAKAIRDGDMDAVSMGANIEKSVCSVCANEAATPSEYCSHVKQKGVTFEITSDNGEKVRKKAYEDCYGIGFFEISNVFDPADPTADSWLDQEKAARVANKAKDAGLNPGEVLAYIGMKNEGVLAKAASTNKPLTNELIEKLADFELEKLGEYHYIRKEGDKWCIWQKGTGKTLSCHSSKEEAEAAFRAMMSDKHGGVDSLMQKGAPYPSDSYKNAPDHSPKGQDWPEEVNAIYNACVRENHGKEGEAPESIKTKCAKIAWATYKKNDGHPQHSDKDSSVKFSIPAEQFVQPVNQAETPGDRNYIPQADQTTAPQHVDTLRSETRCPICHAADMETDPDGIMRCPTCGHVQEPDPVDNPDLSLARDVDLRQDATDVRNEDGDAEVPATNPLDSIEFSPMDQSTPSPVAATKDSTTNEGINEMFTTLLRTSNKDEAVAALTGEIKVARVERKLGANGIHRGIYDAAREAGLKVRVSYPTVEDEENFVDIPGENGVFNLFFAQESAAKLKVPVSEVPIVLEASSQDELDKFVDILENTKRPAKRSRVASDETILPASTKPSDEPKDANVIKDEHEPRETKTVTVTDDTVEMDGKSYKLVEVTEDEPKAEAVEETPEDESKDETDEVESSDDKAKELASEVAEEDEKESKLLAAFKIADLAVELGLVQNESKMAFIAELEEESLSQLAAREATMNAVKEAGLSKSARRVSGIKRVPRLSHAVTASANGASPNDLPDEALFL